MKENQVNVNEAAFQPFEFETVKQVYEAQEPETAYCPQRAHCQRPDRNRQVLLSPQRRHLHPAGHRRRNRYSRHASSLLNRASSSATVRG
jgi:hypothetical protein